MPGRRARVRHVDYWPGFVDALSTMLLAIIFLLSVFMLGQFFLAREVTGKDTALTKLNKQVEELTSLLALERAGKQSAESSLASLSATLESANKDKARLQGLIDASNAEAAGAGGAAASAQSALDTEKQLSARAASQVDILNQQIAALRRQLAAIEDALAASESKDKDSQAQIADLGSRLNVALAQKVQELARYRSDFFGRLRQILGDRPGIRVAGDRFVFQSEVLFDPGQAQIGAAGKAEMDQLATAIIQLEREIPPDIGWVLRVDGHTDNKPIKSAQFPSNWELSTSRATAVVEYLVSKGVDPHRLVAAGFGEFQPLDTATSDDANRKNRRIETEADRTMSVLDDRLEMRKADKAQALGEIAAVLAMIDTAKRDPDPWERLCLLRAFSLVSAGCYSLAVMEARDASLKPMRQQDEIADEPVIEHCDLLTLFEALKQAMGEDARLYPHLGPMALG